MALRFTFVIFLAGFSAAVGQVLVLRELLVLFHGNELSTGLVLACWLLWTAAGSGLGGRFFKERPANHALLVCGFALLCLALPATLLWIRGARALWSVPIGELIMPGRMFLIALTSTAPFCFLSGALFALAWTLSSGSFQHTKSKNDGTTIYLAEAAGAAAGGVCYYFVALPLFTNFTGSMVLAAVLIGVLCAIFFRQRFRGRAPALGFSLTVAAIMGILLVCAGTIDSWSRRVQWGAGFLEARDTAYHNVAFLQKSEQFSLFCNGLWLYSFPDPQMAEPGAHLSFLHHPKPENTLILGDFSPELVTQVIGHPGIRSVDYVRQDRDLATLVENVTGAVSSSPVLREHFTDPKRFLASSGARYDVIVMGAAEPVNAEMNRFYTVEFFSLIKAALKPEGVFSFAIASAHDIIGPREAQLLKSLKNTLDNVFPSSFAISGDGVRFIAGATEAVSNDPMLLIDRLRERKLELRYLHDFQIIDWFSPMRLAYMESVLAGSAAAGVNRDFQPVCFRHALGLWGAQLHPALGAIWGVKTTGWSMWFPGALAIAVFALALAFRAVSGRAGVVLFNTAVAGAVLILLEIVLMLVYQVLYGAMYRELALIIALFMAGMAAGAGAGQRVAKNLSNPVLILFLSQVLLGAFAALLAVLLLSSENRPADYLLGGHEAVFALLALIAGGLGGGQFSMAVAAKAHLRGSGTEGAALYAADLIGAAGGAVIGSLFIIPFFGIPHTLMTSALACLAGSIVLFGRNTG